MELVKVIQLVDGDEQVIKFAVVGGELGRMKPPESQFALLPVDYLNI